MRTTTRGAVPIAILEAGSGPLVICLHGFPDSVWGWEPLLAQLAAAGFHGAAPALRGYAPSGLPQGVTTPADLARDVLALADELGAETFQVVGHDWGAVTAYAVAILAPQRVTRIVTAALPHTGHFLTTPRPGQLWRSRYMAKFQVPRRPERYVRADDWAWLDALIRSWSPTWAEPEYAELRRGMVEPGRLKAALDYYRALGLLGTKDVRSVVFRPVTQPALVIHGSDDGCVAPGIFQGMEKWFPGGLRLEELPGAGHFVHREAPAAFNALVLEHLEQSRESPA